MNVFLALLLIAAMLATVAALVYGIVQFLKSSTEEVRQGNGPSQSALKSNKAMQFRIFFQALAIMVVVLILFLNHRGS
jgi:Na+/H+ antiporter NhaC